MSRVLSVFGQAVRMLDAPEWLLHGRPSKRACSHLLLIVLNLLGGELVEEDRMSSCIGHLVDV